MKQIRIALALLFVITTVVMAAPPIKPPDIRAMIGSPYGGSFKEDSVSVISRSAMSRRTLAIVTATPQPDFAFSQINWSNGKVYTSTLDVTNIQGAKSILVLIDRIPNGSINATVFNGSAAWHVDLFFSRVGDHRVEVYLDDKLAKVGTFTVPLCPQPTPVPVTNEGQPASINFTSSFSGPPENVALFGHLVIYSLVDNDSSIDAWDPNKSKVNIWLPYASEGIPAGATVVGGRREGNTIQAYTTLRLHSRGTWKTWLKTPCGTYVPSTLASFHTQELPAAPVPQLGAIKFSRDFTGATVMKVAYEFAGADGYWYAFADGVRDTPIVVPCYIGEEEWQCEYDQWLANHDFQSVYSSQYADGDMPGVIAWRFYARKGFTYNVQVYAYRVTPSWGDFLSAQGSIAGNMDF
jgi:hypothetical protein